MLQRHQHLQGLFAHNRRTSATLFRYLRTHSPFWRKRAADRLGGSSGTSVDNRQLASLALVWMVCPMQYLDGVMPHEAVSVWAGAAVDPSAGKSIHILSSSSFSGLPPSGHPLVCGHGYQLHVGLDSCNSRFGKCYNGINICKACSLTIAEHLRHFSGIFGHTALFGEKEQQTGWAVHLGHQLTIYIYLFMYFFNLLINLFLNLSNIYLFYLYI